MTPLTVLEQKLVVHQAQFDLLDKKRQEVENSRLSRVDAFYHKWFAGLLQAGDELRVSLGECEFLRPQEGYSYKKDILTLRIDVRFREEGATKVETSFYSTSENSEFELRRMVLIGEVGKILLDHSKEILEDYNTIIQETKDEVSLASKMAWDIESKIRDVKKEIAKEQKRLIYVRVCNEGVKLAPKVREGRGVECRDYPYFEISYNRGYDYVQSLQVVGESASGKTVDIKLTHFASQLNKETDLWEMMPGKEVIEHRVKKSKVEQFLDYYRERIMES